MGTHEPNLFEDATYELSHSAFLAWLFSKAKGDSSSVFGACATGLFRAGTDQPTSDLRVESVHREFTLPEKGKIDLMVRGKADDSRIIWGIETKLGSQATDQQLSKYREGLEQCATEDNLGPERTFLTLYSTRHIVRGHDRSKWLAPIRRDDAIAVLREVLQGDRSNDTWLVEHYLDWLIHQAEQFDPWTEPDSWASYTAGEEAVADPRKSEIVQYRFMRETVATDQLDHLSWGTSRGRPWTQFKVTEYDRDAREEESEIAKVAGRLLYRMDNRTKNGSPYPYLELRQYTLKPERKDLIQEKKKVAEALRTLFTEAANQVLESATSPSMDLEADDSSYVESCPYSSVKYRETAISGFHFFEGRHPDLSELCDLFPAIHSQFIQKLESDRINEFSVSDELKYLGERVVRI